MAILPMYKEMYFYQNKAGTRKYMPLPSHSKRVSNVKESKNIIYSSINRNALVGAPQGGHEGFVFSTFHFKGISLLERSGN